MMSTVDIFRVLKWAAVHKEILPDPSELYQIEKLADDCWLEFLKADGEWSGYVPGVCNTAQAKADRAKAARNLAEREA